MTEQDYEKLLNIKTAGEQKIFNKSLHYNRYEPTSYSALETLSNHYPFTPADNVIDFGCGKGRLSFYLHHFFRSTVTGIEMNPFFYAEALANQKNYLKKHKPKTANIHFSHCFAEEYRPSPAVNKYYFFNPFSLQIFMKVLGNILTSCEEAARPIDIILYYPSEDYVHFLEHHTPFTLLHEIKIPHLYAHNPRHSFLVYRLSAGYG